jgi:hypothetical protein
MPTGRLLRTISLALLALASVTSAFGQAGTATNIRNGGTLPALCAVGQVFFLTTASPTIGMWECTSTNTWSLPGGGLGLPRLDQILNPTADKTFAMGNHALTFGGVNRFFVGTAPGVPAGFIEGLLTVSGPDPNGIYGEMTLWSPALQIPAVVFQSTNGTLAAPTSSSLDQMLGEIEWFGTGTGTPPDVGDTAAAIAGNVDGTVGVGIVPGRLSFQTVDNTSTIHERMRIDSFGNIGISTTGRPVARLEIQNNSGGTNNYGLFLDDQTAATNNWAIKTGLGKVEFGDVVQDDNLTASQCVGTDSNKHFASNTNCLATVPTKYTQWLACDGKGIGDGLNAIPAGTYLMSTCKNTTGVTVTITGVQCLTDNAGSSTLNAAGNSLGALLTGAITCSSSYVAGTQSANVALTNGDYIKFTFVADGTSKQTDWIVLGTF